MNYIVLAATESMLHYRTLGLRYGVHVVLEDPGTHSAPEFDYFTLSSSSICASCIYHVYFTIR